jgi:hypothetical protein
MSGIGVGGEGIGATRQRRERDRDRDKRARAVRDGLRDGRPDEGRSGRRGVTVKEVVREVRRGGCPGHERCLRSPGGRRARRGMLVGIEDHSTTLGAAHRIRR